MSIELQARVKELERIVVKLELMIESLRREVAMKDLPAPTIVKPLGLPQKGLR